jgi:hypothetical protein
LPNDNAIADAGNRRMLPEVQVSTESARARAIFGVVLLLGLTCAKTSHGEPSARERAAAEYDRGVSAFDRGDYPTAADAFLAADLLIPNADALENAISAARRTHDKRLLEATGTRGLSRANEAPELGELARAALAEAATLPDDVPAPVALPAPAAEAPARPQTSTPPPASRTSDHAGSRTWSPVVFYVSASATLVLTGLTVWSGVDTLAGRARLPGTQHDNERVMAHAHRTDALLAATLVTAGATAFIGLRLVAWGPRTELATSVRRDAAVFALRGVF